MKLPCSDVSRLTSTLHSRLPSLCSCKWVSAFFEQSSQGFLVWQIFLVACDDLGLFGFFFFFFFFSKPSHMEEFLQNLLSPRFAWSGLGLWSVALAPCAQPLTRPPSLPHSAVSLAFPQVTQAERAALLEPGLLTLFQKKEVEPLPPDFSQARPGPPPTCLCSYICFYLNLPLDHSLPFLSCCLHKALSSPPCSVDPFHVNYHI